ncbi:MAG: aminotransferase class V-fold PLP-dependent enzyme [Flavobacteriales bacterium]
MNLRENYRTEHITYLDTAHDGLFSKSNAEKLHQIRREAHINITKVREEFGAIGLPKTQQLVAHYLTACASEICLVNSFSVGFNFLLPSLEPFKKVLLLDNDYPSLWMPLGLREFTIKTIPSDERNRFTAEHVISEAEKFQPEIIALSHVQYTTGYMADLKTLGDYCHRNDIIFMVDATQSFGCVPINLRELHIDVLAASTYKWMCAGHGAGFLYVNQSLQQKIRFKLGWYEAAQKFGSEWQTKQSLLNLGAGHKDHEAFYRLQFALEDALQRTPEHTLAHNRELILKLKVILQEKGMELISDFEDDEYAGIIVIKEPKGLVKRLRKNNIIVTKRADTARFSCHFYNDEEDLIKLKNIL